MLSLLQSSFRAEESFELLDIPCGHGEFALTVRRLFPSSRVVGADLGRSAIGPEVPCICMDASKPFPLSDRERFDAIASISGVMEFDNTAGFVSECARRLKDGGRLIITNDNAFTVRDRLSFLLLGRLRRFKLLLEAHQPTYKHIPLQELVKIFAEQKLTLERVEYTSVLREDLLFLPLALLLYPLQWLYLRRLDSPVSPAIRARLFPLRALLCRHYIVVARK